MHLAMQAYELNQLGTHPSTEKPGGQASLGSLQHSSAHGTRSAGCEDAEERSVRRRVVDLT